MPASEEKKLSRKEREYKAHRDEILKAAEKVFTEKGYHAATVEEIAREADFAAGTLYNFFKSKQHLYHEVVQALAQGFMQAFERQVLTKTDPAEAIAAMIRLRLEHFQDHRGFFRAFLELSSAGHIDPSRSLPRKSARLYDEYLRKLTGVFQQGIEQGVFDGFDPLYLALCLEGTINAFVAYWTHNEPAEPLDERIRKMQNTFIRRIEIKLGEVI